MSFLIDSDGVQSVSTSVLTTIMIYLLPGNSKMSVAFTRGLACFPLPNRASVCHHTVLNAVRIEGSPLLIEHTRHHGSQRVLNHAPPVSPPSPPLHETLRYDGSGWGFGTVGGGWTLFVIKAFQLELSRVSSSPSYSRSRVDCIVIPDDSNFSGSCDREERSQLSPVQYSTPPRRELGRRRWPSNESRDAEDEYVGRRKQPENFVKPGEDDVKADIEGGLGGAEGGGWGIGMEGQAAEDAVRERCVNGGLLAGGGDGGASVVGAAAGGGQGAGGGGMKGDGYVVLSQHSQCGEIEKPKKRIASGQEDRVGGTPRWSVVSRLASYGFLQGRNGGAPVMRGCMPEGAGGAESVALTIPLDSAPISSVGKDGGDDNGEAVDTCCQRGGDEFANAVDSSCRPASPGARSVTAVDTRGGDNVELDYSDSSYIGVDDSRSSIHVTESGRRGVQTPGRCKSVASSPGRRAGAIKEEDEYECLAGWREETRRASDRGASVLDATSASEEPTIPEKSCGSSFKVRGKRVIRTSLCTHVGLYWLSSKQCIRLACACDNLRVMVPHTCNIAHSKH